MGRTARAAMIRKCCSAWRNESSGMGEWYTSGNTRIAKLLTETQGHRRDTEATGQTMR